MEEEEITHFSHEHSLVLIKQAPPGVEEQTDVETICRCYGCKEPVLADEEAYRCDPHGCESIFLHKQCAQLPREIKQCAQLPREIMLPLHDQHSLILFASSPFLPRTTGSCDVCRTDLDGFNYYCSVCDFNMDVKCALEEKEALLVYINKKFKHPSHEHLLVHQPQPISFLCNACYVEDKDLSYQCSEYGCPFWIHRSCALLPNTDKRDDHLHTLQLIYELPSENRPFKFNCGVCGGKIREIHWAYYCRACRYFVHIKCMRSPKLRTADNYLYDDDDATFEDRMLKLLLPVDFLHFPVVDVSVELIQRFLLGKNCLKNIQPTIKVFSHPQHPLTLSSGNTEEDEDKRIICDACISPISTTHYSCVECKFFLHLQSLLFFVCEPCNFYLHLKCVMVPKKVGHRFDYHHRLELSFPPYPDHPEPFDCLECEKEANPSSWLYRCKECDLSFHLYCITKYPNSKFGRNIQIDSHTHPLKFVQMASVKSPCHDCGIVNMFRLFAFECETCNFHLCV